MIPFVSRIIGFVAPSSLSAGDAHGFIHEMVKHHPDKEKLAQTLITDLVNDLGIDMFGTVVEDKLSGRKGHPDIDPAKLFIYPYARPSVGAGVLPACRDEKGEIYVAIVRNYVNGNPSQGVEQEWRPAGGYMTPFALRDSSQPSFDENLEATARRECLEELSLDLGKQPLKMLQLDSEVRSEHPAHSLDVIYLADLGQFNLVKGQRLPRIQAGDDVAEACWVNSKDLMKPAIPAIYASDGTELPFRQRYKPALEQAIQLMQQRVTVSAPSITRANDIGSSSLVLH